MPLDLPRLKARCLAQPSSDWLAQQVLELIRAHELQTTTPPQANSITVRTIDEFVPCAENGVTVGYPAAGSFDSKAGHLASLAAYTEQPPPPEKATVAPEGSPDRGHIGAHHKGSGV